MVYLVLTFSPVLFYPNLRLYIDLLKLEGITFKSQVHKSSLNSFENKFKIYLKKIMMQFLISLFNYRKFEEIYPPELKDFVFITDNTFSKKQVLRMEHLILKVLNFDISVPTAFTFQQLYCSMCSASESVIYLSQVHFEFYFIYFLDEIFMTLIYS